MIPVEPSTPSVPRIRVAIYLRVSTPEQDLSNQRGELTELASARRWEIVRVYEETASAARERPVLQQVLADAHRGAWSVLLIWAIDRLGRSLAGNLQTVLQLDRSGVEVISLREPWLDTRGPVRPLLLSIFSWVAEQERVRLGERTRAGLKRARSQGKKLGRPERIVPLERIRLLRARGLSWRAISAKTGVPKSTLERAWKAALQSGS